MRYSAPSSVRVLTALLLALLAAGWGFYFFGLEAFLQAAYHGESLSYFNEFAADWRARQSNPTFQAFFEEAIPLLFRFALLGTIFPLLGMGLAAAYPTQIRGFFSASTSPYNLATGVDLPADLRELAEEAADTLGISWLGVDILVSGDRAVVNETNARPTIDSATKYDAGFWDEVAGVIRRTATQS